jgi:hypothetical protein
MGLLAGREYPYSVLRLCASGAISVSQMAVSASAPWLPVEGPDSLELLVVPVLCQCFGSRAVSADTFHLLSGACCNSST